MQLHCIKCNELAIVIFLKFFKNFTFSLEKRGRYMQADKKIDTDCVRNTQSRDSSFFSAINSCSVSSGWKEREGQADYFSYRSVFFGFDFSGFFIGFSNSLNLIFSSPINWETVILKWEEIFRRVLILGSVLFSNKISKRDECAIFICVLRWYGLLLVNSINFLKGFTEKAISFLLNAVCRFDLSVFNRLFNQFSTSLKSIFSSPMSWETVTPKYCVILIKELNRGSVVFPIKICRIKEGVIDISDAKERMLPAYISSKLFKIIELNKLFLSFPLDIPLPSTHNTVNIINNIKDYLCRAGITFTTLQPKKAVRTNSSLREKIESLRLLKFQPNNENSSLLFGLGQALPIKRRRG